MAIQTKDLAYIYSKGSPYEKTALKDITLHIEQGDFYCILGHTGSGKSTLLQHFNGLLKRMKGELRVLDFDLTKKKPDYKSLRFSVGMVFQYPEYQLFDDTVAKDVAFGPKNMKLSDEEIQRRVKKSIELVGLDYDEIAEKSPFEISGGQKRRTAIAGVISMEPKILVLDEPTAGLDPKGKQEIMSLVCSLKSNLSPTVVMVTHDMDIVSEYATKVLVLKDGSVAFDGEPWELFASDEIVKDCSLRKPSGVKLADELRAVGFDIDKKSITIDSVIADAVKNIKPNKENDND